MSDKNDKRITHVNLPDDSEECCRLGLMTDEQIVKEIFDRLALTVENVVAIARCVKALEDRGFDMAQLKLAMKHHLRMIANGQLVPEALVKFGGTILLQYVQRLPIPDQRAAVEAESFKLMLIEEGQTKSRIVPTLSLNRQEARQVFDADHIRTEGEQISYLRSKMTPKLPAARVTARAVKSKRCIEILEPCTLTRADVLRLLGELD